MKSSLLALVSTAGVCLFSRPSHGEGRCLEVEFPPSDEAGQLQVGVTYTMWIPDGVARFRCAIGHRHDAGRTATEKGATAAYDLHWQALASLDPDHFQSHSWHIQYQSGAIPAEIDARTANTAARFIDCSTV